jgi:hypothetical protein
VIELEAVRRALQELFIDGDPTRALALRKEDEQKAIEVAALLSVVERLLGRGRATTLVDAAAGKAPVGLILARLLGERARSLELIVIERDAGRAEACRRAALLCGCVVSIRQGEVSDPTLWPERPELVVALHACGAAADAVIDRAIAADAKHLLLVPCCYGAAPRRRRHGSPIGEAPGQSIAERAAARLGLPRQALVGRRFAQAVIDAERTLRLEAGGYATEASELVSPRVTPFNLLFRARRVREPRRMEAASEGLARLRSLCPEE